MTAPRLVIGGSHSGAGKTTVTLALLAALRARGRRVQAFKIGPDFIDPGHHTVITGRPSRNLDGWMLGAARCRDLFRRGSRDADLSIIEGMMGVFDGASATEETGSTAEMAKWLGAPVVLVIDGSAMARSVAALALGFARFDPDLRIAGVVFNRVNGPGHYKLLKAAVEHETTLATFGYLSFSEDVMLGDRHLGLVTALEQGAHDLYTRLGRAAAETVDLERLESLAASAPPLDNTDRQRRDARPDAASAALPSSTSSASSAFSAFSAFSASVAPNGPRTGGLRRIRIGLAWDPAFCFYYPENLELLEEEGADLVRFSPVSDRHLPQDVQMLYLGGGYPELHADTLADNTSMRHAVRRWAEDGGVIFAECGGLMYLTEAIRDFEGRRHDMVGLFPIEAWLARDSLKIGYRTVTVQSPCLLGEAGVQVKGHEFHYSRLETRNPRSLSFACGIEDASGREQGLDGLVTLNTLALYTHLHFGSRPTIARVLLTRVRHDT